MSSRKRQHALKVAQATQPDMVIDVALRASIERRKQRAAAAEKHQAAQHAIRAQRMSSRPRITQTMKADDRRADIRMHDVQDIDALGSPKLSDQFAMYLDGVRNTKYRAALRDLMAHAPAQAAAYTAMFQAAWHYSPIAEREACCADDMGIAVSLFRRRLWAAVRFVIGAAAGNVPSVVSRYAEERARAIGDDVRRTRTRHWTAIKHGGDPSLCTKWG